VRTELAQPLVVVSIIDHKFPRLYWSRKNYYVFSTNFVNGLARYIKLRHFESVGSYFFKQEDWRFLCERTFPVLDQVHVEALHPKRFNRPDELDALCSVRSTLFPFLRSL
jgi:hypothetical protein